MKIGIFGDSYAERSWDKIKSATIWYKSLRKHGHDIEIFGESGSSIFFSAKLIEEKSQNYDLVIWCLTTPGRISFCSDTNHWHHVCMSSDVYDANDMEIKKKHEVAVDWIKWLFDWEQSNLESASLVRDMQSRHKNIMVIPCFPPPMSASFNLYNLCEWEARHWFPEKTIPEIYQNWQDLRPGHIGKDNQLRLGELIASNLEPGIFQTSMDNFVTPTQILSEVFQKNL
jgi:hypothetical protein